MGMDALDMAWRLEKAFGITWFKEDYDRCVAQRRDPSGDDLTAGDIDAFVRTKLREANLPIPPSTWHRVQKVLGDVTGAKLAKIRPESHLRRDLGFS